MQAGLFEHYNCVTIPGGGWECDGAIWEFQQARGCWVQCLSRHTAQGPGVCDPE
jgi:hypothetical protein